MPCRKITQIWIKGKKQLCLFVVAVLFVCFSCRMLADCSTDPNSIPSHPSPSLSRVQIESTVHHEDHLRLLQSDLDYTTAIRFSGSSPLMSVYCEWFARQMRPVPSRNTASQRTPTASPQLGPPYHVADSTRSSWWKLGGHPRRNLPQTRTPCQRDSSLWFPSQWAFVRSEGSRDSETEQRPRTGN